MVFIQDRQFVGDFGGFQWATHGAFIWTSASTQKGYISNSALCSYRAFWFYGGIIYIIIYYIIYIIYYYLHIILWGNAVTIGDRMGGGAVRLACLAACLFGTSEVGKKGSAPTSCTPYVSCTGPRVRWEGWKYIQRRRGRCGSSTPHPPIRRGCLDHPVSVPFSNEFSLSFFISLFFLSGALRRQWVTISFWGCFKNPQNSVLCWFFYTKIQHLRQFFPVILLSNNQFDIDPKFSPEWCDFFTAPNLKNGPCFPLEVILVLNIF